MSGSAAPIVVGNGQTVIVPGGIFVGAPLPPPVPTALAGVAPATLQLWLTGAQYAMNALMTGQQTFRVEYSEGSGHRAVTYNKTSVAQLQMWITQLTYALGKRSRRPIGFRF